ncbi:MAG: 4Fe-4S dicluster domain-containing protein [Bacteroidales bacterium]|nr:4Fe-4S dicluster domain-containing protein [Bacteroidales bacterium]
MDSFIFISSIGLVVWFQINIWTIIFAVTFILLLALFLPIKGRFKLESEVPKKRFDERDTMFSRREIIDSPDLQQIYYQNNPKKFELDKEWLNKPGLLSDKASLFSPLSFKAADASFITIEHLRPFVNGEVNRVKNEIDASQMSEFIQKWAKKLGAVSLGITAMQDYHYYSHRGRSEDYGKKVEPKHQYGIAFTVEMNEDFLATGPAGPAMMESANQYVNSGVIAIQIAHFIRGMGFEARAHIDGSYELIAPLLARDAGLGELGRMGLLMTPKLGPRVRIAVVTTDVPLLITPRKPDYSVHDFCNICKKCANICPSQAIQKTPIALMEGVQRWKIDHEKCFGYWCTVGTDCGRCMSVCPYAHKNNWFHNFIRWGIRNNWLFRRLAVYGDDLFYGKKPKPKQVPDWIQ